MKFIVSIFLFGILAASTGYPAPWSIFDSSKSNVDIAAKNYADSRMERWVARSFGDEIPNMRDDLIQRKNDGEGFMERHWNAWTTKDNWSIDKNNDLMEQNSPY